MVDSKICKCLHNISSLGLEIAQWYHHDTTKAQVTENTLALWRVFKKSRRNGKKDFVPNPDEPENTKIMAKILRRANAYNPKDFFTTEDTESTEKQILSLILCALCVLSGLILFLGVYARILRLPTYLFFMT